MRLNDIKNHFGTGEVSPYLLGRTDLAKYAGACEQLTNFIVRVQGGVSRRPGLRKVFGITIPGPGRLIPFFSCSCNSFVLVFSHLSLQIYSIAENAVVQIIDTPYLFDDDLELLKYVRIADIMYLVHPKYPVQKLSMLAIDNWILKQPSFYSPPCTQQDEDISGGTVNFTGFGVVAGTGGASISCTKYVFHKRVVVTGGGATTPIGKVITGGTGIATITELLGNPIIKPYSVPGSSGIDYYYNEVAVTVTTGFDVTTYSSWTLDAVAQTTSVITVFRDHLGDLTITFSAALFIAGDVNKQIVAGTGIANIIGLTGTTSVDAITGATLYPTAIVTILDDFDQTSYLFGLWFLRGSPNSYFSPGKLDITTYSPDKAWFGDTRFGVGSQVSVRSTTKHPTDYSFQEVNAAGSNYVHVFYTGGLTDTFRMSDKNRYVSFAGGYGQIIDVIDKDTVTIKILSPVSQSEPDAHGTLVIAPGFPGSWFLDDIAFSIRNGFPTSITFFQDRLWLAGTVQNPQTIWVSQVDDFENFAKGVLDDDGIEVTIASGEVDKIIWMNPFLGNVILGTFRGEHILSGVGLATVGTSNSAITPSNITIASQSSYGATTIQPIVIQEVLFYVQRSQFNVYQLEFNIQTASFGSKDLNILSNLITETPFIEMAYQQNPYKIVWFLAADTTLISGVHVGKNLIGLTYDREQDVFAWHRHFTGVDQDDSFVSMCCVPNMKDGFLNDEMYFITKRTLSGDPTYLLEVMDNALYVDYASRIIFVPAQDHIAEVDIIYLADIDGLTYFNANGALLPPIQIATGDYNFPSGFEADDIQFGLNYISTLLTVRPEIRGAGNSVQGLLKRWNNLWVRVYKSLGVKINNQFIPNRKPESLITQGVPLFTGDENITNLGNDRDGRILITQENPLPANIIALFGQISVGEN
jgi:hypothetical protein